MKFGDYLRLQREQKGWTQPDAAARADIEQSYLSKLETGKSYPSEEIFERLVGAYGIDMDDLSHAVAADELDRLREIRDVRSVMLERQKSAITFVRGWLVAGLLSLTIGAACLALAQVPGTSVQQYYYRSPGVVLPGEQLDAFDIVEQRVRFDANHPEESQALIDRKEAMTDRVDQQDLTTAQFRGNSFVDEVDGGKRLYTFFGDKEMDIPSPFQWFMVPAFMLLFGSAGCFFISYRWK